MYNTNSKNRFKATVLKSILCDCSDAYILVRWKITITGAGDDAEARQADCGPFINCKSEINNAEIDNANDIHIVMPMYHLIEYSDNYSKTSRSTSGNTSGNTKDVEIIVPLKYLTMRT